MIGPILMVSAEYPPLHGGLGDYASRLVAALADNGWDARVLTSASVEAHDERVLPYIHQWNWEIAGQIRDALRETESRLVHIQYQTGAYGMHPAINFLPRRVGGDQPSIPWVTTFHDLLPPYLFPKAGPIRDWVTRTLARNSDAVIVTNERDLEQLTIQHRLGRRAVMIPIGSNLPDVVLRDRDHVRQSVGIEHPDEIGIGFFGFLTEDKGVDVLLQALSEITLPGPARLVIIGGGLSATDVANQPYLAWIQRQLKECPIPVTEAGFLPPERAAEVLSAMDIVVLPFRHGASLRRGTLIAAVRAGATVLTTDPGPGESLAPLVSGEALWLVAPSDPDALRAGILTLLNDSSLRHRLALNALEQGADFDWNVIAQRHVGLYETLLNRGRA